MGHYSKTFSNTKAVLKMQEDSMINARQESNFILSSLLFLQCLETFGVTKIRLFER